MTYAITCSALGLLHSEMHSIFHNMVCFKVGYLHNGLVLNAVFEALHTNKSLPKLFRRHILRNLFFFFFFFFFLLFTFVQNGFKTYSTCPKAALPFSIYFWIIIL